MTYLDWLFVAILTGICLWGIVCAVWTIVRA